MVDVLIIIAISYLLVGLAIAQVWRWRVRPHRPPYVKTVVSWPSFVKEVYDVRKFDK